MSGLGESWSPGGSEDSQAIIPGEPPPKRGTGVSDPRELLAALPSGLLRSQDASWVLQYTAQETKTTMKATKEKELS